MPNLPDHPSETKPVEPLTDKEVIESQRKHLRLWVDETTRLRARITELEAQIASVKASQRFCQSTYEMVPAINGSWLHYESVIAALTPAQKGGNE